MRKTLVYGTATAAVALALGSGLAFSRCSRDEVEALYGPPPMLGLDEDEEDIETVYGPPPFEEQEEVDPAEEPEEVDDPIEDVYGPPVDFEMDEQETESIMPALYGPPVES